MYRKLFQSLFSKQGFKNDYEFDWSSRKEMEGSVPDSENVMKN